MPFLLFSLFFHSASKDTASPNANAAPRRPLFVSASGHHDDPIHATAFEYQATALWFSSIVDAICAFILMTGTIARPREMVWEHAAQ